MSKRPQFLTGLHCGTLDWRNLELDTCIKEAKYFKYAQEHLFRKRSSISQYRKLTTVDTPQTQKTICLGWKHQKKQYKSVRRQLISNDNSYQATSHIKLKKRQLISSDNSYQATTHINQNSYQKVKVCIKKFSPNNSLDNQRKLGN